MKKLILQLAVLILSIPCMASNYRGMFDIGGGPVFVNEKIHLSYGDYKNKQTSFGGNFSTAHGCQFTPWLFAGAGVGATLEFTNASKKDTDNSGTFHTSKSTLISIPLFVDIRWDLDDNKKITPFADLKLGYQFGMEGYVRYKAQSIKDPSRATSGSMRSADAMFIQATAGARFKVGNSTGINLGISFIPILRREILLEGTLSGNRSFLLINAGIDIQGSGKSTQKEDRKQKLYRLQQRKLKQQSKKINFQ